MKMRKSFVQSDRRHLTTKCYAEKMRFACHIAKAVMQTHTQNIYYLSWSERENQQDAQLDVYYQHFFNMFRTSLCPSSVDQDMCYCTWCAALVLLDVVGSCCGALRCGVRALWRLLCSHPTTQRPTTATNHIQQNQRSTPRAVTHVLVSWRLA